MTANEEDRNYDIDGLDEIKKVNLLFREDVDSVNERVLNFLGSCFCIPECNIQGINLANIDLDVELIIEKNKALHEEIDNISEEIKQRQAQYENYKQDHKLLAEEIKKTHEAFLMGKKFYKKHLKMYYTIESASETEQIIFVQFFTETKIKSEKYSVRFRRHIKTNTFEIVDMNPKLTKYEEIIETLQKTNDVPGALCSIRKSFLILKNK